jgi:putative FmdB family regulatory protein
MPFYDLRCGNCGEDFNIHATVAQREQKQILCPACGGHDLQPVFKAANFTVKTATAPECPHSHICGPSCHHAH